MATEIKLPRLGQGMEAGTVTKWLKSEGDRVEKGEPLYELDTDKVTQEVEADASGVLLKIVVQEGEVAVGKTIAVVGEQGEEVAAESEPEQEVAEEPEEEGSPAPAREAERERGREASVEPSEQVTEVKAPDEQEQPSRVDGGRVKASPLARRIARERGIELAALTGTGPEGRIVAEDVERAAAQPVPAAPAAPPPGEVETVKLTSLRRTVARRMTEAWEVPAFQLAVTVDMTRALAVREKLVGLTPEGASKPTISDLLTKICASALMRHREVNAHFAGDSVELYPSANIGIAVATERGLIVPVIEGCERKSVAEIAAARADVVSRAREAKLQQADLEGGTFTISNLGMYGIERFTAVLNPPQAAILAVGAVAEQPVADNGQVVVRPRMELVLTCDHRTIDGAAGAEFLRTVKTFLEEPGLAL